MKTDENQLFFACFCCAFGASGRYLRFFTSEEGLHSQLGQAAMASVPLPW